MSLNCVQVELFESSIRRDSLFSERGDRREGSDKDQEECCVSCPPPTRSQGDLTHDG